MLNLHFFLLQHLVKHLKNKLLGATLVQCFSQEKDEISLGWVLKSGQESTYLKVLVGGKGSYISEEPHFNRAKRNTADLFKAAIGQQVLAIVVPFGPPDRHLLIELTGGIVLWLQLYGSKGNILLYQEGQLLEVFHKSKQDSVAYLFPTYLINPQEEVLIDAEEAANSPLPLQKIWPFLGKDSQFFLEKGGYKNAGPEKKISLLQNLLMHWAMPSLWYINPSAGEDGSQIWLTPFSTAEGSDAQEQVFQSFAEAYAQALKFYFRGSGLQAAKRQWEKTLQQRIKQTTASLQKVEERFNQLVTEIDPQHLGNLILANLQQYPKGQKSWQMIDYLTQQPVSIKLKADLDGPANAAQYFRKAKNREQELNHLLTLQQVRQQQLKQFQGTLQQVEAAESNKALQQILQDSGLLKLIQTTQQEEQLPFHTFQFMGYEIRVGKNAGANDKLTLKYSFKDDLWFHARDVAGSHVLLKYQAGKTFPQPVIEYAAALAAHFSKLRSEALVPVICTPKKFVRKPKGSALGSVIVEKEQVLLVKPALEPYQQ